jgi:hypothetical protein
VQNAGLVCAILELQTFRRFMRKESERRHAF